MMNSLVILTGAGVSIESGLDIWGEMGGAGNNVDLAEIASQCAYRRDPEAVIEFHHRLKRDCDRARPNVAHCALSRLQREYTGRFLLITQNVDRLHDEAGSTSVLYVHGHLDSTLCNKCAYSNPGYSEWTHRGDCPKCGATALRPGNVWFGEKPYGMNVIEPALRDCNLFVAIGTSGTVEPPSLFVHQARRAGAHTVELNLTDTEITPYFQCVRRGPATEVVPQWVDEVLSA